LRDLYAIVDTIECVFLKKAEYRLRLSAAAYNSFLFIFLFASNEKALI